ncbi:hypothetical protein BC826DRAFT_715835 [Russula brevipes]|nr:hypothetical protein BC826DRAFT_715835 [Russula brevipes]
MGRNKKRLANLFRSAVTESVSASVVPIPSPSSNEPLSVNDNTPMSLSSVNNVCDGKHSIVPGSPTHSGSHTNKAEPHAPALRLPSTSRYVVLSDGFAVASHARNADFHELFKTIPEGDYLIEDYACVFQREDLIRGRIYISENHICFYTSILSQITKFIVPIYDVVSLKQVTTSVTPDAIQITTRTTEYTFGSFLAYDSAFKVILAIWRLPRCDEKGVRSALANLSAMKSIKPASAPIHKVTYCACGRDGQHYSELILDTVFLGTPKRIYKLMFASETLRRFMRENQKLEDIQISDWAPTPGAPIYLARNVSYTKPLNGGVGPRSTKCEVRDEIMLSDFDDCITTVTTTRTPDVPSGGAFSVKTRTCVTWASGTASRVVVTSQVEWTGQSSINRTATHVPRLSFGAPGIIEKSVVEGQRAYYGELDREIKSYIQEYPIVLIPVELGPPPTVVAQGPAVLAAPTAQRTSDTSKRTLSDGRRATAAGATELVRDAWDASSMMSKILYFAIALLILSNLWTLTVMLVLYQKEVGRLKEMWHAEERTNYRARGASSPPSGRSSPRAH